MAKTPPLVMEEISDDRNSLFLTLIEYKRVKYLTIIENVVDDEVQAYVLDNLDAENIDQEWFMTVARRWYYAASDRYPLSFEFAKLGKGDVVEKIRKTFNINSISRVIGRLFTFQVNVKPKIKRRKVIPISPGIEIKFKKSED